MSECIVKKVMINMYFKELKYDYVEIAYVAGLFFNDKITIEKIVNDKILKNNWRIWLNSDEKFEYITLAIDGFLNGFKNSVSNCWYEMETYTNVVSPIDE